MSTPIFLYVPVNPEPWAIGPVGYARRGGKMSAYVGRNQQLDAYKEAVAEAVREQWGGLPVLDGKIDLFFWFWRQRADYKTPAARIHRKHEADATNLQKSTEDALQGILFKNDRDNVRVGSCIMEQGPDVVGGVVIRINQINVPSMLLQEEDRLPPQVRAARIAHIGSHEPKVEEDFNAWPPADGVF